MLYKTALFSVAFVAAMAQPGLGDTYVVDTEADIMAAGCCGTVIGDCSLRGAIQKANQNPGLDFITFGFGASDFDLTLLGPYEDLNQTGDLDILEDLAILGDGTIVVDGSQLGDRVFDIATATTDPTLLQGLTITGGAAPSGDALFDGGGIRCLNSAIFLDGVRVVSNGPVRNGGGVFAAGCAVTLNFTTLRGNTAAFSGGGLEINQQSATLDAPVSAFIDNHAGSGGGLAVKSFAQAFVDNTTFSGNTADQAGSAIEVLTADAELDFVTVVSSPGVPALAHFASGTTTLSNSLIVGTCDDPQSFATAGGNLESPGDTCGLDSMVDLVAVADPGLMPLSNYGGPTLSHMPRADSPAVDDPLGSIANCTTYDQRFGPRPIDGNNDGTAECDIGSFERDELVIFTDGFESGDTSSWSSTVP